MIMKKIFLAAIVALFAINANAQFWAGGSFGWDTTNSDSYKSSDAWVTPEFGYNFSDKMGVGISLGAYNYKTEVAGVESISKSICIAPYFRYIFWSFENVSLFADAGFDLDLVKDADNTFFAGVMPGIAIQCNEKITLATRLGRFGYSNAKEWSAYFNGNLGFSVGIYYNF